jgi:raffinose/stachyose/melibiose transport system substrate-binding protein
VSIVAVTAACSPGGGNAAGGAQPSAPASTGFDTSKPVTITVADGWGKTGTGALFGKILDGFEQKYPNVTVKRETTDYASYQQSINLRGASSHPPDVMMLETSGYGQGFYQFVKGGLLLPLDGYAKAYGWTSRFGAASNLDTFRMDPADHDQWGTGSLYGLPEQRAMICVFYNKALMRQAGVTTIPTTLAEFESSLAAAKAKGITPIAQSNSYIHLQMALWNAFQGTAAPINQWIYGQGGTFASAAGKQAAQTIADWQSKGYFEKGVSGTTDSAAAGLFLGGKAMYYVEGSWMAGATQSSLGASGGVFAFPGAKPGVTSAGGGLSTPLVISAKSQHPDVAAAFLDYFTSTATSDQLYEGGWGMPGADVSAKAARSPGLTSQVLAMLQPIEAEGGPGTTPFIDWATPTLTNDLPPALQKLASGSDSPDSFTASIQSNWTDFQQQRKG